MNAADRITKCFDREYSGPRLRAMCLVLVSREGRRYVLTCEMRHWRALGGVGVGGTVTVNGETWDVLECSEAEVESLDQSGRVQ